MAVRRNLHRLPYRFRLHRRDLPVTPDLVLPRHRTVVFLHGCFWHRHDCRRIRRQPASNRAHSVPKLARNVKRDASMQCHRRANAEDIEVGRPLQILDRHCEVRV